MIKKLKSPFHSNHAEHSADFICEIVDENRVLRKAMEAKNEEMSFKNHYISELKETIEAKAKEIEQFKEDVLFCISKIGHMKPVYYHRERLDEIYTRALINKSTKELTK